MRNLILIGALVVLGLAGCTGKKTESKTFVYCSEGSPSSFNPQLATDGPSFNASSRTIFDRLVEFKLGTTEVMPGLAESWTISKEGLEIVLHLRKGVKFHKTPQFTPSRDFNADDVLFTFNRMREKTHPYFKVGGGSYEYFSSMDMGNLIKDIVKVDDHTVRFVLAKAEAPFIANLAMDFASIHSAEYGESLRRGGLKSMDLIDSYPVGTGPFIFKTYKKDTLIRYTANKNYFRGAPKIDNLIFAITPDPIVRYQKLKAKECHFIAEPSPTDLGNMRTNKDINVVEMEGLNVGYLAMNVEKKPFDNIKVRQAINLALNRPSYIQAIYLGNATVAKNPIPPTMWSFNNDVKPFEYNPDLAKKLLKEAGFPNGFKTELWTLPVSRPYNPNGKKMGELMQSDLLKVGIKVNLVTYDWPTYLEKSRRGEHTMIQLGWTGDNGDPDNFLNVLLGCAAVKSGSNTSRWCDKDFQKLIEMAKTTTDLTKRTDYYRKAQELFHTKVPWAPIAHSKVYRAMSNKVVGFEMSPLGHDNFYYVDLK